MRTISTYIALASLVATCAVATAEDHKMATAHEDEMFSMCDTNKDGKISKEEFTTEKMEKFSKYDKDGDGALSKQEHHMMAEDMHKMMMMGGKMEGQHKM